MKTAVALLVFASAAHAQAVRVYGATSSRWYEDYGAAARISADGRLAAVSALGVVRVIELSRGVESDDLIWPGVQEVDGAVFGPRGDLVLHGRRGSRAGWFEKASSGIELVKAPEDATIGWSTDGQLAYIRSGARDSIVVGGRPYALQGRVTGFQWMDGHTVLVLGMGADGVSTLYRLDTKSHQLQVVARNLDAPDPSPLAVSGQTAYIGLATDTSPIAEERHRPDAPRLLGIYAIDLATGSRRRVVDAPGGGESLGPAVANGALYFTHATVDASVVVVPVEGGAPHTVIANAEMPTWRPDGRQIGFFYGLWRYADFAINWDGGAVDVEADGKATGPIIPIITGYHEDFPPVWSPRGKWIAYHSHRPPVPVPTYDDPRSADDIWLRRMGAPARDTAEIRLTHFGLESGSPDWSPDGTRLVFTTQDRKGPPGVDLPWVITIDTVTGRARGQARLPLPKEIHNAEEAEWAPRGNALALTERIDAGHCTLWIMNADGSGARHVLTFPSQTYGGVAWTPDGKTLIYGAQVGGRYQLFAVSAGGGASHQLTHGTVSIFMPRVSPDGRWIAATRFKQTNEIWRMAIPR